MPLSLNYSEIKRAIARNLGYTAATLPATELQRVEDAARIGLREFYMPRRVAPDQPYHIWSFLLRPLTVTTSSGSPVTPLPSGFSSLYRGLTFAAGTTYSPIAIIPEDEIRALQAADAQTGVPKYAAVRYDSGYELVLYPTPDAAYVLSGRYRIEPSELSGDNDKPLGGALHAETILAACLVASDFIVNPEAGESKYEARFQQLLMASIEQDKALMAEVEEFSFPLNHPDGDSLNVTKRYLKSLIGQYLKIGGNDKGWTHAENSRATEVLRAGLRRFYDPPILPTERNKHQWSFLKPLLHVSTASGRDVYPLPEDFALLEGPLTYSPAEQVIYQEIPVVPESKVRGLQGRTSAAGRPVYAAIRPTATADTETSYELLLWPAPDQEYNLTGRYRINPIMMRDDVNLPLGGQPHAQTVIEACLSAAEMAMGEEGVHTKNFYVMLASSISHDRQVSSPDTVGYNADNSDRGYDNLLRYGLYHDYDENIVTLNGNRY